MLIEKTYQRFELYSYIIGAIAFLNIFISSPYLVNALYNGLISEQIKNLSGGWTINEINAYKAIFMNPSFSLLIALATLFIILSEPINTMVFAKNHYNKVVKVKLFFGIINVVLCLIFALTFAHFKEYVFALFSILIVNIVVLFIRFGYLWIYNWIYLTYNSSFKYIYKNFLTILIPIIFRNSICLFIFISKTVV